MKIILLTGLLSLFGQFIYAQGETMLDDYLWKNRIVLLFAPDTTSLQQQYEELKSDSEGMEERDLLVFRVLPSRVIEPRVSQEEASAKKLRNQYQVEEEEFCVILIGKDGSEKFRNENTTRLSKLYSIIDAMPMRRQEMRRNSKN